MRHILVPTDFSKCAENAIDFAVQSSKIFPAKITLLHSFEVNDNLYTGYVGLNKEFTNTLINDARKKLAEIEKRIEETYGVIVEPLLSTDSLQKAIIKARESKGFDLIIMGTLGASGILEKLWGSNTSAIIGETKVPVMAIPIEYKWQKPRKILFASNRFETESKILNYLLGLKKMYKAHLQVAVYTNEDKDDAATFLVNGKKVLKYGDFLKEKYGEKILTSTHLYGEQFDDTLQNFITNNNVDMLVMVTYPHEFWSRIFNASKTKRMSHHIDIPLLAIPALID